MFYERIRQIRASVLTFFGATAWAHLLQTELQSALTPSYLSHFNISNCNREPWPPLVSSGLRNYTHECRYRGSRIERQYARKWSSGRVRPVVLRLRNLEFVPSIGGKLVLPESFYGRKTDRTLAGTELEVAALSRNVMSPSRKVIIAVFALDREWNVWDTRGKGFRIFQRCFPSRYHRVEISK